MPKAATPRRSAGRLAAGATPRNAGRPPRARRYNRRMSEREPNAWIPHPLRRLGGLALTLIVFFVVIVAYYNSYGYHP